MAKRVRKIQTHPLTKPSLTKKVEKAWKKLKEEREQKERLKKAS